MPTNRGQHKVAKNDYLNGAWRKKAQNWLQITMLSRAPIREGSVDKPINLLQWLESDQNLEHQLGVGLHNYQAELSTWPSGERVFSTTTCIITALFNKIFK